MQSYMSVMLQTSVTSHEKNTMCEVSTEDTLTWINDKTQGYCDKEQGYCKQLSRLPCW